MEPSGGRTAEAKIGQPSKDRRDAAGILTRIHALEAPLRLVTYGAVRDRSRHGVDDVVALGEPCGRANACALLVLDLDARPYRRRMDHSPSSHRDHDLGAFLRVGSRDARPSIGP